MATFLWFNSFVEKNTSDSNRTHGAMKTQNEFIESPGTEHGNDDVTAYIVIGALLASCCCILFGTYIYTQISLKRRWLRGPMIQNGLIISIAISQYDVDRQNDILQDLSVGANVRNFRDLARFLGFTFATIERKLRWTKDELMLFFVKVFKSEFFDENGVAQHDGVIVAISSYGTESDIISSDYQKINYKEIYRRISEMYPVIQNVPRIFIFDTCDAGRVPCIESPIELNSRNKDLDHNLIVVHGATDSVFQVEGSLLGSQLSNRFVKCVMDNITLERGKGVIEIVTDIQHELQGEYLIEKEFGKHTKYLRVGINGIVSE